MTADDKLGFGTGLLAVGLAAGIILLFQFKPELCFPPTSQAEAVQPESGATGAKPAAPAAKLESPHRGMVVPEAICDGIVFVLAVPAGIYFFVQAARTPRDQGDAATG
jgi:hypothetical protein